MSNHDPYSDSPEPVGWIQHHQLYSSVGADIVMESITLRTPRLTREQTAQACEMALIHLDSRYNREGQWPRPASPPAFPLRPRTADEHVPLMKRAIDITGSLIALVLLSPLLLVIALAIKLTSSGPVFSRQKRVGQYGVPFVFLKFRSMCLGNDASIHKEYVQKLIAGKAERHSVGSGEGVYKLMRDVRITRIGGFLRRTSLDELPQFINVRKGEMSLVGPRPAIAYEVEAYDIWQRHRLLEAKPGIIDEATLRFFGRIFSGHP